MPILTIDEPHLYTLPNQAPLVSSGLSYDGPSHTWVWIGAQRKDSGWARPRSPVSVLTVTGWSVKELPSPQVVMHPLPSEALKALLELPPALPALPDAPGR